MLELEYPVNKNVAAPYVVSISAYEIVSGSKLGNLRIAQL